MNTTKQMLMVPLVFLAGLACASGVWLGYQALARPPAMRIVPEPVPQAVDPTRNGPAREVSLLANPSEAKRKIEAPSHQPPMPKPVVAPASEPAKTEPSPAEVVAPDNKGKHDYDIVYVRAPRPGDTTPTTWTEVSNALSPPAESDLMLLHPDGSEELLVAGGKDGAVTDPFVSFDGQWVFYAHVRFQGPPAPAYPDRGGSDIYKIHVPTRKVVQLTTQEWTPNTGVADWVKDFRNGEPGKHNLPYGVFNLGPCPAPGGKIVFTSNRNGFTVPKEPKRPVLQLFVMDDDGKNVELIGHLNISGALHPVPLKDGRIMFSSFENQGLRSNFLWSIWNINPDGTDWGPVMSGLAPAHGGAALTALHFQTQLSDGRIVVEEYYAGNNFGFGSYHIFPVEPPPGQPAFGPAAPTTNGISFNFLPYGRQTLTPFAPFSDNPSRAGKVTHPSGAPDNDLLTVWSPGAVNHNAGYKKLWHPFPDGGIYLLKGGKPVTAPDQLQLIKNDARYNEMWPRALVPYQRIYGIAEPPRRSHANDGKQSRHLPEGTPFGLVGTSSLYKRESHPAGSIAKGKVTASSGFLDNYVGYWDKSPNWIWQGADAGAYDNSDIHAIRILAMEPATERSFGPRPGRLFFNHAFERLRILGEFPVRKFGEPGRVSAGSTRGADATPLAQPLDPDGNPDTSFLAKVPANMAWTFQTLDKDGMVLNMSQTWHQLKPGEVRTNCGGCHAHSQQPTLFAKTAAARIDYTPFDLTGDKIPLLTTKKHDESGQKWDKGDNTGLRWEKGGIKNVEYFRDVKPLLQRSCVACHTRQAGQPAAGLALDDEALVTNKRHPDLQVPGTYAALAGIPAYHDQRFLQATRFVRKFQARRSLLIWKVFGRRTDGSTNEDFPVENPADAKTLLFQGKVIPRTEANRRQMHEPFTGSVMPPSDAVAGTHMSPEGKLIKVAPLTDEDRLTLVRWIDLGCPIDLAYDSADPGRRAFGFACDEQRPTLTLTYPHAGVNESLTRFVVGMHDYGSGLDLQSFQVHADFPVDGFKRGTNLAAKFKPLSSGVWEMRLALPLDALPQGTLTVSVKDRQGNTTMIRRTFSVAKSIR